MIPSENLGSVVHAFISRLDFYPEALLRVVETSLPQLPHMQLPDTVLLFAALKQVPVASRRIKRLGD